MEKEAGLYRNKKVVVQEFCRDGELSSDFETTICLVFFDNMVPSGVVDSIILRIATACPLGIWVAGENNDEIFEKLLSVLSTFESKAGHIMTGVATTNCIAEAADVFLLSAIPDMTRWQHWNSYRILIVDANSWVKSSVPREARYDCRDKFLSTVALIQGIRGITP